MTRNQQFLRAIGEVQEDLIADAALPQARPTHSLRRIAALLTAAVLCVAAAVPALAAADVEPIYQMLYAVAPAAAQALKPVQMAYEDNGIRMEVVSALAEGNRAQIEVTLQDLTGDRIDETTDLLDSYSIHRPFDSSAACTRIGYDPATKTAAFLISITRLDGRDISGGKITFSLRELLSHKQNWNGPLSQLDLKSAATSPAIQTDVELRGASGMHLPEEDERFTTFLLPQKETAFSPMPGVHITAAGWIDGQLHIQSLYENILELDNHGSLWLQLPDGTVMDPDYSQSFWEDGHQNSYDEDVFSITPEVASQCQLYGNFVGGGLHTSGDWQVTFSLETAA